jgi:hypothetical protein
MLASQRSKEGIQLFLKLTREMHPLDLRGLKDQPKQPPRVRVIIYQRMKPSGNCACDQMWFECFSVERLAYS